MLTGLARTSWLSSTAALLVASSCAGPATARAPTQEPAQVCFSLIEAQDIGERLDRCDQAEREADPGECPTTPAVWYTVGVAGAAMLLGGALGVAATR